MQGKCDKVTGRPPNMHPCHKRATVRVWSGHFYLEFCERHESTVNDVKAPFAEPRYLSGLTRN